MYKKNKPSFYFQELSLENNPKSVDNIPTTIDIFHSGLIPDRGSKITAESLKQIVKNFDAQEQIMDVPITYDHPSMRGAKTEAAGWVTGLFTREEGDTLILSAEVDWNKKGAGDIFDKVYRYVSCEIYWEFYSPNDGETLIGSVLKAVSLTNDPALVKLNPITSNYNYEGYKMEDDKMKEQLEEMKKKYEALKQKYEALMDEKSKDKSDKMMEDEKEKYSRLESSYNKLKTELEEIKKKEDVKIRTTICDKLISEGKMTPATKSDLLSYSKEVFEGVVKTIAGQEVDAYAKSQTSTTQTPTPRETITDLDKLDEDDYLTKVEKYASENKVSITEAFKAIEKQGAK